MNSRPVAVAWRWRGRDGGGRPAVVDHFVAAAAQQRPVSAVAAVLDDIN